MHQANLKIALRRLALRRLPPLNALRAFEAAARHRNLSRAAEELCVTHGAVSRQVAKLEEYLGAKLFERGHQQLVLTRRGAAYAERLSALLDQVQDATNQNFFPQQRRPQLRIGVLPTFAMRFLIPRLARFKRRYPELTLQVQTSYTPIDPGDADIDVGIWLDRMQGPDIACEPIWREEVLPVASPSLLSQHAVRTVDDLEPFLLLHAQNRPNDWSLWLEAAGATRVDGQAGLRLEYSGLVYQGAVDGLGLAMAQTLFVQDDIAHHRLVPVFEKPVVTGRSHFVVTQQEKGELAHVAHFIAWLKDEIAATVAALKREHRCETGGAVVHAMSPARKRA